MNRTIFIFLIAAILIGCAAPQRLSTPSGNPEILISNVSKKEVIDFAVDFFVHYGFEIKDITDDHAVFTMLDDSLSEASPDGSKDDSIPEYRIKFTFTDLAGCIRVLCTSSIVTNPGASEVVEETTSLEDQEGLQNILINFKKGVELEDTGMIGINLRGANLIRNVVPGYSAEEVGIQAGDRIIRIGGEAVPDVNDHSISYMITGDVGTFVGITVLRDGQEMTFKVERRKRPSSDNRGKYFDYNIDGI